MKRSLYIAAATALSVVLGMPAALAQDGPPHFRPLEVWSCTYNDGMDEGDMNDIYEDLNEQPDGGNYSGYHMDPYFVGTRSQDTDFIYIGVWENGADMPDMIPSQVDTEQAWDEAASCSGYLYASLRIQELAEDDGSGNFVLVVSDCRIGDGHSSAQAMGGLMRYNDYKKSKGSTVPTFAWFPALGDGNADAEFDFKLAMAFPSLKGYGTFFNWYEDNAIYQAQGEMLDGLVDCDDGRLYFGRTVVGGAN